MSKAHICFNCDGLMEYPEAPFTHSCTKGITANINRLHNNVNLLLRNKDEKFWEGFDACLEIILNHLDNADPHIWTDLLKSQISLIAELYKKDG